MPEYRSRTTTQGRNMAGARSLWRATGMSDGDFDKPIIAVVNSFTQFVPGHVHLKDLGQMVGREIERAGGVAKEFNTIAIDDGIAMGHGGMLYSLPSREIIADSVEYMVNAHCADAMVCISNCDKITPGMLNAALRLNIPAIFVSGGPMESGKTHLQGKDVHLDLIDAMISAADENYSDDEVVELERSACPTCGSCAGMFTANSMNCLTEALGVEMGGPIHKVGSILPGITGALGFLFLWSNADAKFLLAVPTSIFGMVLLPIAYFTFFCMINSKELLGDALPKGGKRVALNLAIGLALLASTIGAGWSIWSKAQWKGFAAVGIFLLLALGGHYYRKHNQKLDRIDSKLEN